MSNERKMIWGLSVLCVLTVLFFVSQESCSSAKIRDLQNQIAERDRTVEVQKQVYSKLAVETDGLKKLLDTKDEQLKLLLGELKDRKAEILTVTSMAVAWKKAYEGAAEASQSEEDPPDLPQVPGEIPKPRARVDFNKDFGAIVVSGHTVTNPAEAYVKVSQGKPLKISLVVSEEPDGSWRTYATSSDENIAVDIGLTAVNPKIVQEQWYEKISFNGQIAAGPAGFLGGVGAAYQISQFSVGPNVYATSSGVLYGVQLGWHPFWRQK